jgi:hypothetical protein
MANENPEVLGNYFIDNGSGVTLPIGLTTLKRALEEVKEKIKTNSAATLWERTKDKGAQRVDLN